jgi:DNA polymerase
VSTLACIAEDELVLTDKGLVPIQNVTKRHKVWDGVAWVCHGGVVYKGIKEVISYDGLTATKDHIVFTEDERHISFGACARKQKRIAQTGLGGQAIRLGESDKPYRRLGQKICATIKGSVHRLLKNKADRYEESSKRQNKGVPSLLATTACANMAVQTSHEYEDEMSEPQRPELQTLWGAWDRVSLQFTKRSLCMDYEKLKASHQEFRVRPNKQQWPLRAWKFTLGLSKNKCLQHQVYKKRPKTSSVSVFISGSKVCGQYFKKFILQRFNFRANRRQVSKIQLQTERRVWDILDAGPNNRYTVSGKLVHNCGYQGGKNAFTRMAETYGAEIDEDTAVNVVTDWRNSNIDIVNLWTLTNNAAVQAVEQPGRVFKSRMLAFRVMNNVLYCKLPSGRLLAYNEPSIGTNDWGRPQLQYMGLNSVTNKWTQQTTYGGDAVQSAVQGIARDIMAHAMLLLEKRNYEIVLTVHDEIIAEVQNGQGSLADMEEAMCTLPDWASGLPLEASGGYEGKRYRK